MAEETSDSELLTLARRRDREAVAELYTRHRAAARRLATSYRRAGDPDDLVNEAFFRVFGALERGAGPDDSFRAYLFVTLRRAAMEIIARTRDEPVAEVPEPVMAEARAPALDVADRQMIIAAYGSLPARQQSLLWQTAVEGRRPRELAPVLGLSANAVSAVASRARDQLREAYLQAHVATTPRPQCEPHRSRLGAYVRDGLGRNERADTQTHVNGCESCFALVGELTDVNTMLVRSLVPIFAGMSKAGVLVAGGGGAAAVLGGASSAGGTGPAAGARAAARHLFTKLRSNPGASAGAVAATVVVAAGLAAALVSGPGADEPPPRGPEASAPSDGDDGGSFPPTSAVVDRPTEPAPADPDPAPAAPPADPDTTPPPPPADPDTAPAAPPASTTTTSTPTTTSEPPDTAPTTDPQPTSPPPPDTTDVPSTTESAPSTTTAPLPGSHATPPSTIPPSRPTPPPSTIPPSRPTTYPSPSADVPLPDDRPPRRTAVR